MGKPTSPMAFAAIDELKKHPDTVPSKTIAKILFNKYPELFTSVEQARSRVKYYRGADGSRHRKHVENGATGGELVREHRTPKQALSEFNLQPISTGVEDYIFPHKKPLVLSDIHMPYHNIEAVEMAVEYGVRVGCDSFYLNGDILDCARISRWAKDAKMQNFETERDMFWEFIKYLKQFELPIFFKVGNHEVRIENYLMQGSPELAMLPEFGIDKILQLPELGITYIKDRQKTLMGKLIVIHGHEFGESFFSPVNPARGLFLKAKCTVLCGHNHQTSEHHENNLKGDSMACFSTGALCDLAPSYRPFAFTKWNLGFAIVEIDDDGGFEVWNKRIVEGKIR